jgi:DNA-binding ferritin-like protein
MKPVAMNPSVETAENIITALIKSVGTHAFFVGLHNAHYHGKAFNIAGHDVPDEILEECFTHFDELNRLSKLVENEY